MKPNPDEAENKNGLRLRAEEVLASKGFMRGKFAVPKDMTREVQALVHELQVHQIELEMQNEELQKTQELLSVARDRYFDLFDLAPVGYFILSDEGTILDVNLTGADLLGVERPQLLGKALSHFVSEQDQDILFLSRRQANQTDSPVECELRLVKANGLKFYAHLEYARSKDPVGQLRLIVSDVNQRSVLEQDSARDKAILAGAESLAHLGGWEWDIEKDEVRFTEELQRIYGCEKSVYSMMNFILLAHPEDRAAKKESLEKALSGDAKLNFGHRILRQKDHQERYLQVSGKVFFDKTGKPVRIVGASQDVTELKENERCLKANAEHLTALNSDLESFTSVASHDLQAPLRKIQKFAVLTKSQLPPETNEDVLGNLDRIQRSAARMQNLISDLLAYARVTNRVASFDKVNLKEVVLEVVDNLDTAIESSHAEVEIGDLPVLDAEATLMKQLFQNLIENALKFHPPEKVPVVTIVSTHISPQLVEIHVRDQGIGFDEQYLEKIFRPFERLHGTNQYIGTGIGLAICRKIVERHSGSITAHSMPGMGATFVVTLPVQQS